MKKIFITGTAGFIGFHLAQKLKQDGHNVIGYDNFNNYYNQKLKRDRANILLKQNIETIEGDICNYDFLFNKIKEFNPSCIVHLAAQAGVRYSLENPQSYIDSNIQGFINILEICRTMPQVKLVYASSSSVYGLNEKTPFSTTDQTDLPTSLYAATKKSNELMAFTYHHLYKIPTIGLRFFTVYGPFGRPDMAYFSFTKDILNAKPIKIFNHGKMERDFTYIDDVIDGIISAIDCPQKNALFNLGNNKSENVLYLVELIENILGKTAEKRFLPMQPGEVEKTFADIESSQKKLHFMPKISLEEGMHKFINWFKSYYEL